MQTKAIQVPAAALDRLLHMQGAAIRVYLVLAARCPAPDAVFSVALADLAAAAGITERAARAALGFLGDAGLISRVMREGKSSRYSVLSAAPPPRSEPT